MRGRLRSAARGIGAGLACAGALAAGFSTGAAEAAWTDATRFASPVAAAAPVGWVVSTLAGTGVAGFADGAGAVAQFSAPSGITIAPDGSLVVGGGTDNRVRRITTAGVVSTIAGTGVDGLLNGPAATAQFTNPFYPAFDAAGNLYVGDAATNQVIRRITPAGIVSTFATGFNAPRGLTFDPAGNLYVANGGLRRIDRISPSGVVTTIAGSGVQGFADGAGAAARFCDVRGIARHADGTLYVADSCNARIRRVTPGGVVSTFVSGIDQPAGVAFAPSGDLIVSTLIGPVLSITPAGIVTTIAGSTIGFQDGPGPSARFGAADGITVAADGTIYVVDTSNHRIRRIVLGPVPW